MKEIPLTQGQVALVDDEDYEQLMQYRWFAHYQIQGRRYYAETNLSYRPNKSISMHRLIMGADKGIEVDHIDFNGLNNTRANLRLCTHSDNMANQKLRSNNKSGYKGVYWHKGHKAWVARLGYKGKKIMIGEFKLPELAAAAYDKTARIMFGQIALTNEQIRGDYAHTSAI